MTNLFSAYLFYATSRLCLNVILDRGHLLLKWIQLILESLNILL